MRSEVRAWTCSADMNFKRQDIASLGELVFVSYRFWGGVAVTVCAALQVVLYILAYHEIRPKCALHLIVKKYYSGGCTILSGGKSSAQDS